MNLAALPAPSAKPASDPAMVETSPDCYVSLRRVMKFNCVLLCFCKRLMYLEM